MAEKEPSMRNIPQDKSGALGKFVWQLVEDAIAERERLELPERWKWANLLARGGRITQRQKTLRVNLIHANKSRTVANLTSRDPSAEAVPCDGNTEYTELINAYLTKWWKNTRQKLLLRSSVDRMEEYGATVEKYVWDPVAMQMRTVVMDLFAVLVAPGYWQDVAADAPYVAFLEAMDIDDIKAVYGVDVVPESTREVLGNDREENRPDINMPRPSSPSYATMKVAYDGRGQVSGSKDFELRRLKLVAEVWMRDRTKVPVYEEAQNPDTMEIKKFKVGESDKYPGQIRVVTVCQSEGGAIVLADEGNRSINQALPAEVASQSFLYRRFPMEIAVSHEDSTSIWGFSIVEQIGDLAVQIDDLFSKLVSWALKSMAPIFVCPNGIGITKEMLTNRVNLILRPNRPIPLNTMGYIQTPNLPVSFFNILQSIIAFFDRVYSIEDADRGVAPKGVIAASAIAALQERNAVTMQHKMGQVERLVESRGNAAISMLQNFGTSTEIVDAGGTSVEFIGTDLAGQRFNYTVETGSLLPRTSLQIEALAERFYGMGAIDRQALLQSAKFPDWRKIVERVGEGQLGQALQILVQAGLPQEVAIQLQQTLMQPQGGPNGGPGGGGVNGGGGNTHAANTARVEQAMNGGV